MGHDMPTGLHERATCLFLARDRCSILANILGRPDVDRGAHLLTVRGHVCQPSTTGAAAGFAGLLIVVLKSGEVREMLLGIVRSALSLG
jgi:hypothetical protein